MLALLIGKREKGELPRRIHRPGDRILFIFCLACHLNSSRFRIASLAVNRLTGSRPPLRATPVCQSFSSPSKGRRGLVATLPPRQICSLKIFYRTYLLVHTCTRARTPCGALSSPRLITNILASSPRTMSNAERPTGKGGGVQR